MTHIRYDGLFHCYSYFIANLLSSLPGTGSERILTNVPSNLAKAASPTCHPSRLRMDSSDLDPI